MPVASDNKWKIPRMTFIGASGTKRGEQVTNDVIDQSGMNQGGEGDPDGAACVVLPIRHVSLTCFTSFLPPEQGIDS